MGHFFLQLSKNLIQIHKTFTHSDSFSNCNHQITFFSISNHISFFLEMKQGLISFWQNFEISATVISATSLCSFELECISESFLYILYNLCYYAQCQFLWIFVGFWMNLNRGVFVKYKHFWYFCQETFLMYISTKY